MVVSVDTGPVHVPPLVCPAEPPSALHKEPAAASFVLVETWTQLNVHQKGRGHRCSGLSLAWTVMPWLRQSIPEEWLSICALKTDSPGLNPSLATYLLCDLGQII